MILNRDGLGLQVKGFSVPAVAARAEMGALRNAAIDADVHLGEVVDPYVLAGSVVSADAQFRAQFKPSEKVMLTPFNRPDHAGRSADPSPHSTTNPHDPLIQKSGPSPTHNDPGTARPCLCAESNRRPAPAYLLPVRSR